MTNRGFCSRTDGTHDDDCAHLNEPHPPYGELRARLVTRDGIGWGDPFCVTPCEPDRECEIDDGPRAAVWSVEAMGCHYDGEPPEVGPTADACGAHVNTLLRRWTDV